MKYYKVIKDGKVIDVLDRLVFVKYQKKHDRMLLCAEKDAQAIMSSDNKYAWHENSLLAIPVEGYDTVSLEEIDVYEYNKLKFELSTDVNEILEQLVLELLERGVL